MSNPDARAEPLAAALGTFFRERDATGRVGTFTPALFDEAQRNGWTVISMKSDWKRIFAFDERS